MINKYSFVRFFIISFLMTVSISIVRAESISFEKNEGLIASSYSYSDDDVKNSDNNSNNLSAPKTKAPTKSETKAITTDHCAGDSYLTYDDGGNPIIASGTYTIGGEIYNVTMRYGTSSWDSPNKIIGCNRNAIWTSPIFWTNAINNNLATYKYNEPTFIGSTTDPDTIRFIAYRATTNTSTPYTTYLIGGGSQCYVTDTLLVNIDLIKTDLTHDSIIVCKKNASDTIRWNNRTITTNSINPSATYQYDETVVNSCPKRHQLFLRAFTFETAAIEKDTACDMLPVMWKNHANGATLTKIATNIPVHYDRTLSPSVATYANTTLDLTTTNSSITFDSVFSPANAPSEAVPHAVDNFGTIYCPVTYTLSLKIFNHDYSTITKRVCDSAFWDKKPGYKYTYSMTTPDILNDSNLWIRDSIREYAPGKFWPSSVTDNSRKCHDTLFLNLTIDSSSYAIDSVAACKTYTWINDSTYTYDESINTFGAGTPSDPLYTFYGASDPTSFTYDGNIVYGDIRDTMRGVNPALPVRTPHSFAGGNAKGCDSIISLWLKTYPIDTLRDTVIACKNYTWAASGKTYYSGGGQMIHNDQVNYGQLIPTTGIYTIPSYAGDTYHNYNGGNYTYSGITPFHCDSVYKLHLQLDSTYENIIDAQVTCDSFLVAGRPWTNKGDSVFTFELDGAYIPISGQVDTALRRGGIDTTWIHNDTLDHVNPLDNPGGRIGTWNHTLYFNLSTARLYCDSIVTLNLTLNKSRSDTTNTTENAAKLPPFYSEFDSICGDYPWHNANRLHNADTNIGHTPGTRQLHFSNVLRSNGCDSTLKVDLYVRPYRYDTTHYPSDWATSGSFCPGSQYITFGTPLLYHDSVHQDYHQEYNYLGQKFSDLNQCDSIFLKYYHVWDTNHTTQTEVVCDSFIWRYANLAPIDTFYASIVTNIHNPDRHGCDSVNTLFLTVNYSNDSVLQLTTNPDTMVCEGYRWNRTGAKKYYIPDSITAPSWHDTASVKMPNANIYGCDSTLRLPMLLHQVYEIDSTWINCDTVKITKPNGQVKEYYTSVIDTFHWYSSAPVDRTRFGGTGTGCDSIVHNIIIVAHADTTHGTDTAVCDHLTWLDTTFTDPVNIPRRFTDYNGIPLKTRYGCDSAAYLNLSLKPNGVDSVTYLIKTCDQYEWNLKPGYIYNTIGDTIDSITTRGLAANGCDTITVLKLRLCSTGYYDTAIHACDKYVWYGNTFYTSTVTTHKLSGITAVNGCDSVIRLTLTVDKTTTFTENNFDNSCDSISWNGKKFKTDLTGYIDTIPNVKGCDSIITLNLTLKHGRFDTIDSVGCDSIRWHGETYHVSTYNISNKPKWNAGLCANGCDSTQILSLKLNKSKLQLGEGAGIDSVIACDKYVWPRTNTEFNRNIYAPDADPRTKCDTLKTSYGCDSAVYLHLTLHNNTPDTTNQDSVIACGEYTWYDTTVYQRWDGFEYVTGLHTLYHNLTNTDGCDSTLRIHITVNANKYADTLVHGRRIMPDGINYYPSVCDSFAWRGKTLASTGLHFDTVHLSTGCDSVYAINLIVSQASDTIYNHFRCQGAYTWHDSTYIHSTDSAFYILPIRNHQGCDSVARLHLTISSDQYYIDSIESCDNYTWHGHFFDKSITDSSVSLPFSSVRGCDSTVHLYLFLYHSIIQTDTVNTCDSYFWNYNNRSYTTSKDTTYYLTDKTVDGCDSARRLLLTLHYSSHISDTVIGCEEYKWNTPSGDIKTTRRSVNGHNESNWRDEIPGGNQYGCDSTTYLVLTIDTNSRGIDHQEFCNILTWNGYNITTNVSPNWTTGYFDTIFGVAANGCDSIYVLEAVTRGSYMATDTVQACDRYMWKNNVTYFTSNTTATRTIAHAAANNCDSIYTLHLTLFYGTHNVETANPCDTILWNGITRRSEGRYTYSYVNEYACPSVDTLILTLRHSTTTMHDMGNQCNYYTWAVNGQTYHETTTDKHVFPAANGCDSILRLSVVINHSDFDDTAYLSGCDSVLFDGVYYYRDTVIDRPTGSGTNAFGCPEMHRTYISVFPTYDSTVNLTVCDSLTWRNGILYESSVSGVVAHEMTINGCDSAFTLNLTVNYGTYATLPEVNTCDIYRWHDSAYTVSTTARYIVGLNSQNCDSAVLQPIVIKHRSHRDTTVVTCDEYNWTGAGRIYTSSTIDSNRVGDNSVGCDSMVVLNLTVNPTATYEFSREVCDSLVWNDSVYRLTNSYEQRYANAAANGCDSVATIHLVVNNSVLSIDEIQECDNYTWPVNGRTYSVNTYQRIVKGRDSHGCDSASILRLTLRYKKTVPVYQHACDSFSWRGRLYLTSGTYSATDHRGYGAGCDSTTNLRLDLGRTSRHTLYPVACDKYTWYGTIYTQSGDYVFVQPTPNATNCDSISLIHLTINHNDTTVLDTTACDSITWYGTTYQWSQRGITNLKPNAAGCTTYDILNLRMGFHSTYDARATTACDSLVWHGTTYRATTRAIFDTLTTLGCDSTIRMNVTIRPSYRTTDNVGDQCGSYTWHGNTYTESNNTATFRTPNAGPNGCDTIVTLNLAIREQGPYRDTVVACNAYLYLGSTITYDTTLSIPGTSQYGCDSTILRNITIARSYSQTIDSSVCDSIEWMGNTYTASGRYQRVFPSNVPDCDSVLTLNFTVRGRSSHSTETLTACPGYRWYGEVYTNSIDTTIDLGLTNAGCDSTATLHYTTTEQARFSDTVHRACDRFVWNGQSFTTDTVVLATFNMASGCDSLSLLRIFVRPTPTATDQIHACDSFTWRNGITYRGSTSTPTYRVDWGGFCDSVYSLQLALGHSVKLSSTKAAKDYYQWGDTVLLQSGTYTRAFPAANGCDSIVTLRLTITDQPLPILVCNDDKLLMVNHYPYGLNFDRVDYMAYRWYRNGVLIPNANLDYYSEYGYTLLNGCYHVEVAIDAELTAWLPSEPYCIGTDGIDDAETPALQFAVMPNPVAAGSQFTIRANSISASATLDIYDLQGRRIHSDTFNGTEQTYNLPLASGIYTIRLTTPQGQTTTKKLIVK